MSLKDDATRVAVLDALRDTVDAEYEVRQRGDPLAPAIWFLVAEAGHVGCGGWTFDRRDKLLRCVCGTALYKFREMVRQFRGQSAAPARPARKAATE